MKRGCVIAVGLIVVLIAVVVVMVFMLTGGAAESAETFLGLLAQGKTADAYASASAALQARQDEAAFAAVIERLGLDDYASATWTSRSVENERATIEGSVTTRAGGTIPLTIELVKEGGTWKVFSLQGPQAGAAVEPATPGPQVPAEAELKALALRSMLDLNQAIQLREFTTFYGHVSYLWQQQTTPDDLRGTFQAFIDREIDFAVIQEVGAVFDQAPALAPDGVLTLAGHYPTHPARVLFELRYVLEGTDWRLLGVSVSIE
ncbi:MAG: hypothetical protein GY856_27165 [bacterium]|nr:hypothetical protein [bacterium]